jgi:hypothetical protein
MCGSALAHAAGRRPACERPGAAVHGVDVWCEAVGTAPHERVLEEAGWLTSIPRVCRRPESVISHLMIFDRLPARPRPSALLGGPLSRCVSRDRRSVPCSQRRGCGLQKLVVRHMVKLQPTSTTHVSRRHASSASLVVAAPPPAA